MNKKLNIALRNRSTEQGFAIPIAVGLGLIMILLGVTMVVRSQGDQVTASAQKATADSLAIAETGVTRVQAFLNKNSGFANKPYPWTDYLSDLPTPCRSGTLYNEAEAFDDPVAVNSNAGQFEVISYSAEGVLVVEGQALQGTTVKSTSRLQVNLALDHSRIPSFDPPGMWAQQLNLGNNRITGNVIDAGCPPGSLTTDQKRQITASGGTVTNDPTLTLPPALTPPTVCTGTLVYPLTCAMSLSAITSGTTILPRTSPADVANANGEYVYYVAKSGNDSISLSGSANLIIKPGTKVKLYLEGNINTSGGGVSIGHNCYDTDVIPDGVANVGATKVSGCESTNFQMFGGTGTTEIVFAGNNTVDAFIFAPNAINSGVNGTAEIRGSIWLKEWDRSNANQNVVSQTGGWNNIPSSLWPPRIAPIKSWQRQEVP